MLIVTTVDCPARHARVLGKELAATKVILANFQQGTLLKSYPAAQSRWGFLSRERQRLPQLGRRLLLDAQSRIGTWLSAVDVQADSTASRSLPGQAETPDASEQVSPLPQPKVSAAARRLQEWRLTRESTLSAETEAPQGATVPAEPKQELGESGAAQPTDVVVEATVGEAVVRIQKTEEPPKTVAQLAAAFERPSNVHPKGKADVTSASMSKTPVQEEGDEPDEQPAREAERAEEAVKGLEDKVPSSAALQVAAGKLMERVKAARERKRGPWPEEEDAMTALAARAEEAAVDKPKLQESARLEEEEGGEAKRACQNGSSVRQFPECPCCCLAAVSLLFGRRRRL
ncbi:GLYK [Symbiodinium microadriaticum]|nr:GLYK [Symbiodinium microadriaticum]